VVHEHFLLCSIICIFNRKGDARDARLNNATDFAQLSVPCVLAVTTPPPTPFSTSQLLNSFEARPNNNRPNFSSFVACRPIPLYEGKWI
jgi:hypothetical protein